MSYAEQLKALNSSNCFINTKSIIMNNLKTRLVFDIVFNNIWTTGIVVFFKKLKS